MGQAAAAIAGRLFPDRRVRTALLELAGRRTAGSSLQHGMRNTCVTDFRSARPAGAGRRSASVRDGLADSGLPNLSRNRHVTNDALVSSLSIHLQQTRIRQIGKLFPAPLSRPSPVLFTGEVS